MAGDDAGPVSGWTTYEVVDRDDGVAPVSEALKLHASQAYAAQMT